MRYRIMITLMVILAVFLAVLAYRVLVALGLPAPVGPGLVTVAGSAAAVSVTGRPPAG